MGQYWPSNIQCTTMVLSYASGGMNTEDWTLKSSHTQGSHQSLTGLGWVRMPYSDILQGSHAIHQATLCQIKLSATWLTGATWKYQVVNKFEVVRPAMLPSWSCGDRLSVMVTKERCYSASRTTRLTAGCVELNGTFHTNMVIQITPYLKNKSQCYG